ncbi:MAG: hypothetical protein ACI8TE_000883 [Francisella sp.]|jgi:hypothetical protein
MADEKINDKIISEAKRIEEDCDHSSKRHFNASDRWGKYSLWIGLLIAVITAITGVTAFNEYSIPATILSILATVLISASTFLKPSERVMSHLMLGNKYLTLRNNIRLFRELEINDIDEAIDKIKVYSSKRDELNDTPIKTIRRDYELAKDDIDEGRNVIT